jgi:hypothetical protein
MDLLTTYTQDSELQAVTGLLLIYTLQTLQITTAHTKPQSSVVFPSCCLVTALSNKDSSASVLMPLPAG